MTHETAFAMRGICVSLAGFAVWSALLLAASCSRGPSGQGRDAATGSSGPSPATRQTATNASLNGGSGVNASSNNQTRDASSGAAGAAAAGAAAGAAGASGASGAATPASLETAMFGAGCFWGVEDFFMQLKGVHETAVGFAGGAVENPTYKQVCTTDTGHAEVVWVRYDPAVITYEQLLDAFFRLHDPTQLNRQGPDFGEQYRSAVFCFSDAQRQAALAAKERLTAAKAFPRPIVTRIEGPPAAAFFRAEEYHQKYLLKNGLSSCHLPR